MTVIHALILAFIEGITEFLPISSTGHMILANTFLPVADSEFVKSFEIIIQLGAICAVLTLYWRKLLWNKYVLVAFVPTGIIGFIFYQYIKDVLLGNPWVVVTSLGVGGVLLIILEALHKERNVNMTLVRALAIGAFQSLSIVPGVSRAAATIVGALILGIKREAAVEFSFLLAVPTMAAATGLDLVKTTFTPDQAGLLVIGFVGAFVTALVTVKWFIMFVKRHTFLPFAFYRILVALAFIVILSA